jgi:hypothetical protein
MSPASTINSRAELQSRVMRLLKERELRNRDATHTPDDLRVYSDAQHAGLLDREPLFEISVNDGSGRRVSHWFGGGDAWSPFKLPTRRVVGFMRPGATASRPWYAA